MTCKIIAEAGVNHNGDFSTAKKLVEIARECGADCVKFQTWVTDELLVPSAPKAEYQKVSAREETQYDMVKRLELPFEEFRKLKEYAEQIGIQFLSTPDDEPSLNFLVDLLGMTTIKVGSGEITNLPFLRTIGQKKRDVIFSTGMASLGEVERAYHTLLEAGARSLTIMHCVSAYPAPLEALNLRVLPLLRDAFQVPVGFSDHSLGVEAAIAAVALGATVIEKHFTLDKEMKGPDHKASLNPSEFADFVSKIRGAEIALSGDGKKVIQDCEKNTRSVVLKGIYARNDISENETISVKNLSFLRPNQGIGVEYVDIVCGKKAKGLIRRGVPIRWGDLV